MKHVICQQHVFTEDQVPNLQPIQPLDLDDDDATDGALVSPTLETDLMNNEPERDKRENTDLE